jgi:hypothetical protein
VLSSASIGIKFQQSQVIVTISFFFCYVSQKNHGRKRSRRWACSDKRNEEVPPQERNIQELMIEDIQMQIEELTRWLAKRPQREEEKTYQGSLANIEKLILEADIA